MPWFTPKLPIADDLCAWVDSGFDRLSQMLGRKRMLEATMVLPENRFFPDRFDGSKEAVDAMARRIARYMSIDEARFVVDVFAGDEEAWKATIPFRNEQTRDAAGLYFHEAEEQQRHLIGVHASKLKDPLTLAATLAHELAHVVLLGGSLLDRNAQDMEPMTDLCTVFLGMGFFGASAAFQFRQWTGSFQQGWSTNRLGYLPEELWGYALARFAFERGEHKPQWANELPTNVRAAFRDSAKWLEANNSRHEQEA